MATAGIVVSVSMGVMKPLLSKLTTLMGDEYKKLKDVRKQVSFLKDELTAMDAFLETLELMGDDLDPLAKHWRSHVREMAYDIEDCIDDFLQNLESKAGPSESKGFVKKAARRLRTLRVRHRIASQIDELKTRVLEAGEQRKRYNLDERLRTSGPSSSMAVDPRVKAMYTEAANLVGIDGPREELVKMLTDRAEQRLKVVSIVGFGGLGKTTLAKEAYDNILSNVSNDFGEKFGSNAFISVSQRPDISSLLSSIESKLGMCNSSPARDIQDIIKTIKDHLKHKREASPHASRVAEGVLEPALQPSPVALPQLLQAQATPPPPASMLEGGLDSEHGAVLEQERAAQPAVLESAFGAQPAVLEPVFIAQPAILEPSQHLHSPAPPPLPADLATGRLGARRFRPGVVYTRRRARGPGGARAPTISCRDAAPAASVVTEGSAAQFVAMVTQELPPPLLSPPTRRPAAPSRRLKPPVPRRRSIRVACRGWPKGNAQEKARQVLMKKLGVTEGDEQPQDDQFLHYVDLFKGPLTGDVVTALTALCGLSATTSV